MSKGKAKKWNNLTDKIMTSERTANDMIEYLSKYFDDSNSFLEHCRWTGNIYKLLPSNKSWCEIDEWVDFYDCIVQSDWIITNPPYSDFDRFLDKCMEVADNIALLVPLAKPFSSLTRIRKIQEYGWIVEIKVFPYSAGIAWFPFWFPICILYIKKWYKWDQKIVF